MRAPSTTDEYLQVIQHGLAPRRGRVQEVLILGAGIAGLTTGYELLRAT